MTVPLATLIPLYLAFVAKHLVADFFLQTNGMARGKAMSQGWARPLAGHAGVHAAGTLLIALVFAPSFWWLAAADFVVHALIDRGKVRLTGGWTQDQPRYWWAFGIDQSAHQLTHFAFVVIMASQASAMA